MLLALAASLLILPFNVQPIRAAPEQTPTGWYWPTGKNDSDLWLGFMKWNQAANGWHLAQDFALVHGLPVYAIADGEVVLSRIDVGGYGVDGTRGGALVARFETSIGEYFAALYGHIDNPHAVGKVKAGQILGYTNGYDHLHFGIHPGYELAEKPWSGYTHLEGETYGWVDPMQFLLNNRPSSMSPIPEFSAWVLLLTLVVLTLGIVIVFRKKCARFIRPLSSACALMRTFGKVLPQLL